MRLNVQDKLHRYSMNVLGPPHVHSTRLCVVLTVQGFLPATLTLLIKVGLYFYFKLYFLDDDEEEVKIIYKGMGYY